MTTHRDQLTLPGFATIKRIRQESSGQLQLLEYDVLQWKEHEKVLDARGQAVPKPPRFHRGAAYEAWQQQVAQVMTQPIPPIKPIRVWDLGCFSGAGVLPWLQGKREALSSSDVEQLKIFLQQAKAEPPSVPKKKV